jgi:hypothetical protein
MEMNVEWRNFSCRQGYKDYFTKIYSTLRHSFSSSSETSSTPRKCGGTVTSATDHWKHRVHLAGEYSTVAGRWSYFTILGKDNNLLVITCYRVCHRPPPSNIDSSYYQQSSIMESEDEAMGIPIYPNRQMICYLKIFIQSYQQQGFLIFLLMDGNQDSLHVFQ